MNMECIFGRYDGQYPPRNYSEWRILKDCPSSAHAVAMNRLTLTSCMAPNADAVCAAIAQYLTHHLDIPTEFINHISWVDRERLFDAGELLICWICGLPYVWKADQSPELLELLAAPVMQGDRYQSCPVYFSDIVVRHDSPFQRFDDLRGTVWAYNEPRSHSGYYVTCAHLATLGEPLTYFGQFLESGAHETSLQWLLAGSIDASAIDSTVLETELHRHPALHRQIRIIGTLGPSPAPPWVISTRVPQPLRDRVRSLFLTMHETPWGQSILAEGAIAHFAPVIDADYAPIRAMAQRAESILKK